VQQFRYNWISNSTVTQLAFSAALSRTKCKIKLERNHPKPVKTDKRKFGMGKFISVNLITESVESFTAVYPRAPRQ
jgi:hypothetical protein